MSGCACWCEYGRVCVCACHWSLVTGRRLHSGLGVYQKQTVPGRPSGCGGDPFVGRQGGVQRMPRRGGWPTPSPQSFKHIHPRRGSRPWGRAQGFARSTRFRGHQGSHVAEACLHIHTTPNRTWSHTTSRHVTSRRATPRHATPPHTPFRALCTCSRRAWQHSDKLIPTSLAVVCPMPGRARTCAGSGS